MAKKKNEAETNKIEALKKKLSENVQNAGKKLRASADNASHKVSQNVDFSGIKNKAKEKVAQIQSSDTATKVTHRFAGVKKSYLWAGIISVALILWLGSGLIFNDNAPITESSNENTSAYTQVKVEKFSAKVRQIIVTASGRTEALRRIDVRARTSGVIVSEPKQEGETVLKGDLLCELDLGVRSAKLAEAKANLAEAELNYNAALELIKEGFVSKTRLATVKAKLDAAKASLSQVQKDIDYTRILAPENGIIAKRPAEPGSFLQVGGECATITVQNPMLVVVNLSEKEVAGVTKGLNGKAKLSTGRTIEGKVRFVAPTADQNTRTFRVELEVENTDFSIRDGVSAELTLPVQQKKAHLFSPSILTLNKQGKIGVRVWQQDNTTKFVPVTIIDDGTEGVWVTGLNDQVVLVTVGHEYVQDGEKVNAIGLPTETNQAGNMQK